MKIINRPVYEIEDEKAILMYIMTSVRFKIRRNLKVLSLKLGNKVSFHNLHRRVYLPQNPRDESPKYPLFLFLCSSNRYQNDQ